MEKYQGNLCITRPGSRIRSVGWSAALLFWLATLPVPGHAHGVSAGDLQLDHPYAVPSAAGEPNGKAYLRGIRNSGEHTERLLGASTSIAAEVQLHSLKPEGKGLRATRVEAIELPPKTTTRLRHTGNYRLTLIDLKKPLKDGDRFDLTLRFEHAGSQTVKVWVQTPRDAAGAHGH